MTYDDLAWRSKFMKILRVLQYSVCVLLRQWSEVQNKALFRCVCFITAGPVITRYHSPRGFNVGLSHFSQAALGCSRGRGIY